MIAQIKRKKDLGQVMVEYVLMVAIIAIIAISLGKMIRDKFLVADASECTPNSDKLVCIIFMGMPSGNFKRFKIIR